ncbi:NACHT domain-containing protein [Actinoplanes sp. M2I2]|uniref:NACHT domain-containing protein n=1 Tax=Actinoplanes sp. M2I2 TaxID=1734444 RepID=UPI002021B0E1|nr:NACHT domain-containing protein [Actinoplanes sp. M2I2]
MRRSKRFLSVGLTVAAVAAVAYILSADGLERADQLASVLALLVTLGAALFGLFTREAPPQSISQVRDSLGDQIDALHGPTASDEGIYQHYFLPPQLCRAGSTTPLPAGAGDPAGSAEQYQAALAAATPRSGRRVVVLGASGSGKTTLALMLTLGLRRADRRELPLLVSVNSWNVEDESFRSWLDRQLALTYRAADALGDDRVNQLVYCDDVLIILDGLDRLGETRLEHAMAQINATIPLDRPLVVLSRPARRADLGALTTGPERVLHLRPSPGSAVRGYLRFMAARLPAAAGWDAVTRRKRGAERAVHELLRSPLLLDVALRTYRTREQVEEFLEQVRRRSAREAGDRLLDDYLAALDADLRTPLSYVAYRLGQLKARSVAWWRAPDGVPSRVLAVGAAASLLPAYQLALVMPPGLTRGLAIGTFTGVLLGLLRARRLRRAAGPAALTAFLIVVAVGALQMGPGVAVADAVQIPVAVLLVVLAKDTLMPGVPAGRTALAVAGVGAVPAAAVAVLHELWPWVGPDRHFAGMWIAVSSGVAVATFSARLLVRLDQPARPSRVTLRSRGSRLGNPLPHVAVAITSATAVGAAGGVVGLLRGGPAYGVTLAVFFGLVAGIPIGVVAGLLRWLNQPAIRHVGATPVHTLRCDWLATAGCLVTVGLVSSGSIALVVGPLRRLLEPLGQPVLVRPLHGLLFGASIGLIVACYYNAAPGFLIAVCWFRLRGRLPVRLMAFLRAAETAGLLRRVGAVYEFRHEEIRARLAWQHEQHEPGRPPTPERTRPARVGSL